MDILPILTGVTAINLGLFWLYLTRTRHLFDKVRSFQEESNRAQYEVSNRLMGRIEHRLVNPSDRRPEAPEGVAVRAVVITYNRREILEQTLRSINEHEPLLKILVIDNGSSDDTQQFLAQALQEGLVDRVLLNSNATIPQWQKAFNFHQAHGLLEIEPLTHLVFFDDDVKVTSPFIDRSLRLLETLKPKKVRLISLLTDQDQNDIHPTLEQIEVDGTMVRIKQSFNGAFVIFPIETLEQFGLPPIREGIDDLAVEDWYYTRRLQGLDLTVACIDNAIHLGAGSSSRELVTGK